MTPNATATIRCSQPVTVAELVVGLGLIFGVATRLAAVGGLLLIGPIWLMLLHTAGYLWEYPAEELFPLVLLPSCRPVGRVRPAAGPPVRAPLAILNH